MAVRKFKNVVKKADVTKKVSAPVKKETVINVPKSVVNTVIIAVVIAAAAVVLGAVVTISNSWRLKNETSGLAFASVVTPGEITIKDQKTGKEYTLAQTAPSANFAASSSQPSAVSNATGAPTVVPAPTATEVMEIVTAASGKKLKVPAKYKALFKDSAKKEDMPSIDIDQAKFLFDSGKALFVDARSLDEYEQAHIKGAIPVPAGLTQENIPKFKSMMQDKVLVSYCHGTGCHLANKTANALYDAGYHKVCVFWGGWPQWTQKNYPITQKTQPTAVPAKPAVQAK